MSLFQPFRLPEESDTHIRIEHHQSGKSPGHRSLASKWRSWRSDSTNRSIWRRPRGPRWPEGWKWQMHRSKHGFRWEKVERTKFIDSKWNRKFTWFNNLLFRPHRTGGQNGGESGYKFQLNTFRGTASLITAMNRWKWEREELLMVAIRDSRRCIIDCPVTFVMIANCIGFWLNLEILGGLRMTFNDVLRRFVYMCALIQSWTTDTRMKTSGRPSRR